MYLETNVGKEKPDKNWTLAFNPHVPKNTIRYIYI